MACRWILPTALSAAFLAFSGATQAQPRPREDFDSLVARADQARMAGRISEAYHLYSAAYQYKDDPTIAGRMALLWQGSVETKIEMLMHAMEADGGATDAEKTQIVMEFRKYRPLVCLLRFHGNLPDAQIWINGSELLYSSVLGARFRIVSQPGQLFIRSVAKGLGEAVARVDCPAGGSADAVLAWSLKPEHDEKKPIDVIVTEAVEKALMHERCLPPSHNESSYQYALLRENG